MIGLGTRGMIGRRIWIRCIFSIFYDFTLLHHLGPCLHLRPWVQHQFFLSSPVFHRVNYPYGLHSAFCSIICPYVSQFFRFLLFLFLLSIWCEPFHLLSSVLHAVFLIQTLVTPHFLGLFLFNTLQFFFSFVCSLVCQFTFFFFCLQFFSFITGRPFVCSSVCQSVLVSLFSVPALATVWRTVVFFISS